MENNGNENKSKSKRNLLLGLSVLVFGALAFFGIKTIKKKKTDANTNSEGDAVDTEDPVQNSAGNKPAASLPAARTDTAFPLAPGAKGQGIKTLQLSLIKKFGGDVLKNYGADGYFGNELSQALRAKGYGVPLSKEDYNKITGEKEETLKSFDPSGLAKALHTAIVSRDYASSLTLLKSIGNIGNYAQVSEHFKQLFLFGVRRSIVNAMLGLFPQPAQKESTRKALLDIGLKYNANTDKWLLSGFPKV